MVNIRATLPGQAQGRGRIVIGGHYDTKLIKEFRFVGASDGASSAAFLLEMARALKGRANPLPIELLFLDGEEAVVDWNLPNAKDHTYGSRYYVEQLKKAGTRQGRPRLHPRRHDRRQATWTSSARGTRRRG